MCSSTVTGTVKVKISGHVLSIQAGDKIRLHAKLQRIRPAANPGDFDYQLHARSERRLCQAFVPFPDCISILDSPRSFGIMNSLRSFRLRCYQILTTKLDEETSELAAALFLGIRESLPRERIDSFFLTGTMHLLAISGLHVVLKSSLYSFE